MKKVRLNKSGNFRGTGHTRQTPHLVFIKKTCFQYDEEYENHA